MRVTSVTRSGADGSAYGMISEGLRLKNAASADVLTTVYLDNEAGSYACLYFLGPAEPTFDVAQLYDVTLAPAKES